MTVPRALRWLALALLLLPGVARAQPLPLRSPREPLIEVAVAGVGADVVVNRDGLRGRGAALCLVDTGADGSLETLRDADGASRIRAVWDAALPPRGAPTGAAIEAELGGAFFGRAEVDDAPNDAHGHGTAMAAIALGDGAGIDAAIGPTAGVAPAASLLVARAYDAEAGGFEDEAVVRAVRFCRLAAEADPELDPGRLVVLLSLGSHDGAHDGRGAFERAILRAAGAAPVVVAAGNDGGRVVHASGRALGPTPEEVVVQIPRPAIDDARFVVTVRLTRRDPDARFTIVDPSGARSPALDERSRWAAELPGARVTIAPQEGEAQTLRLTFTPGPDGLSGGAYGLVFEGASTFDVWLAETRLGPTFLRPELGGRHAQEREAIRIPATAPEVITVGASVARAAVTTGGGERTQDATGAGAATFSSVGPTPAGVPKPDLVAPGGWVLVPLSTGAREGDASNLVGGRADALRAEDGRVAIRGTSVSAALVAGALLLATERDPTRLSRARELLVASADGDGWTPETGWGQLDVPTLLERWGGAGGPSRAAAASRAYAPSDGTLWITARAPGATLSVEHGRERWTAPILAGAGQLAIPLGPRTVGDTLALEVLADGAPVATVEVPVVLERGADVSVGRGGCAVGPARAECPLGPVGLLLLAGLATRRPRRRRG